jgi:hypothetical protein
MFFVTIVNNIISFLLILLILVTSRSRGVAFHVRLLNLLDLRVALYDI